MKLSQVKVMLKEAIADHIARINETGDIAASQAKIGAIDSKLMEITQLEKHLNVALTKLKEYVDASKVDALMDELKDATTQLNAEKERLKNDMTKGDKKKGKDEKKVAGPKKPEPAKSPQKPAKPAAKK